MHTKNIILSMVLLLITLSCGQNQWQTESENILQRYGSLPKGVILEGQASGFNRIETIKYRLSDNTFILNQNTFYPCPIPRTQVAAVLLALSKDDRIGVSIVNKKVLSYGALRPDGETSKALVQADKILVSVIFGWTKNLEGITLPHDYIPKQTQRRQIPAVSINKFKDYNFALVDNVYYLQSMKMINLLLPVGPGSAADGGYLPGQNMELLSPADLDNLDEIKANSRAYIDIPQISKAAKIGEFAAFARYLRNSGNLNLATLAQHVARSN